MRQLLVWSVNQVEELDPLLMQVLLHVRADDFPVGDIESHEQRCRAVALVVMGPVQLSCRDHDRLAIRVNL